MTKGATVTEPIQDLDVITRLLERERRARQEAESLLESKSMHLFEANERLAELASTLAARERYVSAIFTAAQNGIVVIDPDAVIESANPAAYDLLGFADGRLIGLDLSGILTLSAMPEDLPDAGPAIAAFLGRHRTIEAQCRRRDGSVVDVLIATGSAETDQGDRMILVIHDRSEQLAAQEAARRTAFQDILTGLDNRAALMHRFATTPIPPAAEQFAVIVFDIQRFQRVNDSLGRAAGDRVFTLVAERLMDCITVTMESRSDIADAQVARIGGDEFAVVLRGDVTTQTATDQIASILQAFEEPFVVDQAPVTLEVCLGFCLGREQAEDVDVILERAGIALEHAQAHAGERFAEYRMTMDSDRSRVIGLEHRIRRGLDADEFVAYFQPRIDVISGEIVASEALVRWAHPERGLLMPGEFIPIAEQSSLILELGRKVVAQALNLQARCVELGIARPVSINIAPNEFAMPTFTEDLHRATKEAGIPASLIEIELKESILTEDIPSSVRVLEELRDIGFLIAMDDFGTGHSSLGRLRDLPIDVLKLDRSFVSAVPHDGQSANILVAMVRLAEAIGARVVVEGVESDSQLTVVREAGECEVQGFLYSPAVDAERFVHLLRNQPWMMPPSMTRSSVQAHRQ